MCSIWKVQGIQKWVYLSNDTYHVFLFFFLFANLFVINQLDKLSHS